MPQKTISVEKIRGVIDVLMQYPEGIWLRRLSKESKVPLSSLYRYLEGFLAPYVENIGARNEEGRFFGVRIVKLKAGIAKQLQNGIKIEQLVKTNQIVASLE